MTRGAEFDLKQRITNPKLLHVRRTFDLYTYIKRTYYTETDLKNCKSTYVGQYFFGAETVMKKVHRFLCLIIFDDFIKLEIIFV